VDKLPPPPLLGFNNNVLYNGRMFHIQTEDSGIKYCRVVTHLFADGGRILRTCRTDYSLQIGRPDLVESIRQLMKDQHRTMFSALRAGEFDATIQTTFDSPTQAELDASQSPMSQRPQLRSQEMPALTLPAPGEAAVTSPPAQAKPASRRPSSRPKRQSSRAPANNPALIGSSADGTLQDLLPVSPSGVSQVIETTKPVVGRPAKASNDTARRKPSRSIFGDAAASEQSLDDVILSYLDDDTGEGSSGS